MSQREENKQENRRKILKAAELIIRKEGIEKLSMRHLAKRAGVSLRTPYNLFGSKTDVLLGLFNETIRDIMTLTFGNTSEMSTDFLLTLPDKIGRKFKEDEAYYQGIYWQIMSADASEARDRAIVGLTTIMRPVVAKAQANKELDPGLDTATYSRHIMLLALALVGMWGGQQLTLDDMTRQVRYAWCSSLLSHCTRKSRSMLEKQLRKLSLALTA